MANCPKCGVHLKPTDWRQHCPHCGANIVVYDLQERLMQQADVAEVQHYHFQKRIDRLKASFVGSKLAIVRIFTSFVPPLALLLPIAAVQVQPAFSDFSVNVSLITLYEGVETLLQPGFLTGDRLLTASLALLLGSIVLWLLHFALLTLACSPRAKARAIILNALLLLCGVGAPVLFALDRSTAVLQSGRPSVGSFVYAALLLLNAVIDFATLRQGIAVHHKQCYVGGIPIEEYFELQKTMTPEELRAEQYRRLQAKREEKEAQMAQDAPAEATETKEETEVTAHGG